MDHADGMQPPGYDVGMKSFSTAEAADRFVELLDAARRSPVAVTERGRPAAVMLSLEDYERLRGTAWDRLAATMARARHQAQERGLTDEVVEALLVDGS